MATRTLPLFPLSEVVLFPGMVLPLHIFEPRYIAMVEHCLAGDQRFGVALIRSGPEVGGLAEPCAVGTTAVIRDSSRIEERFVLLTHGEERFQILRSWSEGEVLMAEVEAYPDDPQSLANTEALAAEVRGRAAEHLRLIGEALGKTFVPPQLPDSPVELSFLLASGLQGEPARRQELLELTDTAERLRRLRKLLGQQVATLSHRLEIHEEAERVVGGNGHLDHKHLTSDILNHLGEPEG
ncbi:MAG: LON peptidase substrate-binding domain-containing protein [Armatimonadetes bacterium]|nr:LON peptidase substrate-binding domain-containing protein [Armatimonadota bacterium]